MNTAIRLQSKYLLSKNIFRLFMVSFISLCLRWGALLLTATGLYFYFSSSLFEFLCSQYGFATVVTISVLVFTGLFFLTALFTAGVKMGESFLYFTRAQGSRGNMRLLFKYLAPKKAFRALRFYAVTDILKVLWLLYFLFPCILCVVCDIYVYSFFSASPVIHIILSVSISLLFSISVVMWRACVARYSAAPYYFCLNPSMKASEAIKKSIRFTDGFLTESVLLEYSLLGWILSCVLLAPLAYVVPYVKLCKCVFVTQMLLEKPRTKENLGTITFLSSQHIN